MEEHQAPEILRVPLEGLRWTSTPVLIWLYLQENYTDLV